MDEGFFAKSALNNLYKLTELSKKRSVFIEPCNGRFATSLLSDRRTRR
jgi:hypothetical protein